MVLSHGQQSGVLHGNPSLSLLFSGTDVVVVGIYEEKPDIVKGKTIITDDVINTPSVLTINRHQKSYRQNTIASAISIST